MEGDSAITTLILFDKASIDQDPGPLFATDFSNRQMRAKVGRGPFSYPFASGHLFRLEERHPDGVYGLGIFRKTRLDVNVGRSRLRILPIGRQNAPVLE